MVMSPSIQNNDKKLQDNIATLAKNVVERYAKCIKNINDEEAIHNYRIAIKKTSCAREIDAIMGLDIFNDKVVKKHQSMFTSFGELRTLELVEDRYSRYLHNGSIKMTPSKQFIEYIDKKKKRAINSIEKTNDKANELLKMKILQKTIGQNYKPFCDCYEQIMLQAKLLLSKAADDYKQWHPLRKHLKKCIYMAELLSKKPRTDLVELQELLGKWHDAREETKRVDKYLYKHHDQSVEAFKKKLIEKRKKIKKQIKEMLAKSYQIGNRTFSIQPRH